MDECDLDLMMQIRGSDVKVVAGGDCRLAPRSMAETFNAHFAKDVTIIK